MPIDNIFADLSEYLVKKHIIRIFGDLYEH